MSCISSLKRKEALDPNAKYEEHNKASALEKVILIVIFICIQVQGIGASYRLFLYILFYRYKV